MVTLPLQRMTDDLPGDEISTAALVVSHYREDLGWLDRVDRQKYTPVVVSKTYANANIFLPHNVGDETSAYLEYIVRTYDTFPEVLVFVHGHEHSWHHAGSMPDLLNHLPLQTLGGIGKKYHNFNCANPKDSTGKSERERFCKSYMEGGHLTLVGLAEFAKWQGCWTRLFAPVGLPAPTHTYRFRQSAQFVLHRDLIRQYTRDQWRSLLDTLYVMSREANETQTKTIDTPCSARELSVLWEYTWCLLFTGHHDEWAWDDRFSDVTPL